MLKYGNRHFATITSMEDVMTFFNRNWMMPRPLVNVNQLKLYDKRLDRYINEEKVNMATIHFLIFLILYTEQSLEFLIARMYFPIYIGAM